MYSKNISLIGFMGSGKSTAGKVIAESLNYLFVDLDKIIEYICEASVKDIFKKNGESYFRAIENKIINKTYYNKNCVFACGGGAFKTEENIKIIRKNSCVVYLAITEEEAYERLKNSKDRPLLLVGGDLRQNIKEILGQRTDIYSNNCDIKIDIGGKSPEKIKDEVLVFLNLR